MITNSRPEAACDIPYPDLRSSSGHGVWNGTEVIPHSQPWLVSFAKVYDTQKQTCAGALISSLHVLCTQHCNKKVNYSFAILGEHDKTKQDGEVKYRIKTWWQHPKYKSFGADGPTIHDLAIAELKQRVKFNDFIKPICLLPKKDALSLIDETVMVSGWGKESLNGKYANKLMTTNLTIMSEAKCKNAWDKTWGKVAPYFSESTICAAKFQTDACADCGGRYLYSVSNRKVF